MEKNNKAVIAGAVMLSIMFIGFFVWAKSHKKGGVSQLGDTSSTIPFVVPGIDLVQHIHPELKIFVDGTPEVVPANIGLGLQHRVLHTHETDGIIHVESQDKREYTLGDFMSVWGKAILRPGYTVTMTVDGAPFDSAQGKLSSEMSNLKFKEGQKIVLTYTKEVK